MVIEGNVAAARSFEPAGMRDALTQARTPLDVLCALAEEGAGRGFDLWAMATTRDRLPAAYLCTVSPLAPLSAATQLAHFTMSASDMECEGDCLMPDWSMASQQVMCLRPQLPPLEQELAEYRDFHLRTGEQTGTILRAAVLSGGDEARTEATWSRLPAIVQYATPFLRSMNLSNADTARGMIDMDSGMYSWPYFMDAIEREVERARRYDSELSLAVLELKPLRMLGEIPAELHRRVGEHVAASVRRTDMVGRVGKRSYAIFFHNTGPRPALIAAGRIADALGGDEAIKGIISFSLGVSGWEKTGSVDVSLLLAQAGEAAAEAALVAPGSAFVYI